ncbi:16S rRNA processing protein RimM [Planifilum fulgidum]|jgi:16S rRNA processing protein RimM|uniref:Ribosome maturation factor RimM n=2 Tax=Planifilum fulgidum TaxID=201973 RepID=A0A1I2R980_9BACL|nr:16S rRNA processing protein RimM [Planifilum fulgidum]
MRVMNQPEWLKVGQIVGTHGIRGEVRVISRTDFPEERFSPGVRLMLRHPRLESPVPLTVERSRPHKRVLLIKFREWNNINDAEPYKGGELVVEGSEALDLDEGEYYFYQIIGCEVVTTEGERVGVVEDILQLPANDVWVVRPDGGGRDILIPYIDDVVRRVDPEAGRVTIRWMEGLR